MGIFMADIPEETRKPGRPPELGYKPAELKLYVPPELFSDFKELVRDSGVSGTEIGRRLIAFFLSCPRAIQYSVIGRGGTVSSDQWAQVAKLIRSSDDDDQQAGGSLAKIEPKSPKDAGGAAEPRRAASSKMKPNPVKLADLKKNEKK